MLNEIIKGMSNAAEKINENFQLLNTEEVLNENGQAIKLPFGYMICFRRVTPDRSIKTMQTFSMPEEFAVTPFVAASHAYGEYEVYQRSCVSAFVSCASNNNQWAVAFTETTTAGSNNDMFLFAFGKRA